MVPEHNTPCFQGHMLIKMDTILRQKTNLYLFKRTKKYKLRFQTNTELDNNNRKRSWKLPNICKLKNILLNNHWIKNKISKNILNNENWDTTYQNVWDTIKVVPGRKFIIWIAYISKEERSQVNNLSFHLKKHETQGQINFKVRKKRDVKINLWKHSSIQFI